MTMIKQEQTLPSLSRWIKISFLLKLWRNKLWDLVRIVHLVNIRALLIECRLLTVSIEAFKASSKFQISLKVRVSSSWSKASAWIGLVDRYLAIKLMTTRKSRTKSMKTMILRTTMVRTSLAMRVIVNRLQEVSGNIRMSKVIKANQARILRRGSELIHRWWNSI